MTNTPHSQTIQAPAVPRTIALVGRGRVGTALARALGDAGLRVLGPLGPGEPPAADAVLLCVPDDSIPVAAAAAKGAARLVGHTSGATPLSALIPAGGEAFGLHPLQTFSGGNHVPLHGCGCAVAGSTPGALGAASGLADLLGMRPFAISDAERPAYHAAASIASNFLVTLAGAAERVAAGAGLSGTEARSLLAPLVRTTVDNWATQGPERALTGPVARGDEHTVSAQREAVAEAAPELLGLFDALVERTRDLAAVTA